MLSKINEYANETKPVLFESVNLLPHLTKRDLPFPGIVLLGESYESSLERNIQDPRWGSTPELQELDAKTFWEIERPNYQNEAVTHQLPIFANAEEAFDPSLKILKQERG